MGIWGRYDERINEHPHAETLSRYCGRKTLDVIIFTLDFSTVQVHCEVEHIVEKAKWQTDTALKMINAMAGHYIRTVYTALMSFMGGL